ncbi:MAG: MATE family efflux transporter [Clostridia bacterium]|nr:MATE family efflux transporter [Clostridia bacterium]
MSDYEQRLGTQKMLPLIFSMSLPAVAAQLVNLLYSIIDRVYIGHIPDVGTDALAGIGITSSVIVLIAAFSQIVGSGGAPLAAMALGSGDRERAGKILGNGFVLLIIFSVVLCVPVYIFMKPILNLIGASDVTFTYAADYLSVYLTGTIFVMFTTGLTTFINAQGRSNIAMVSVLIGAAANIALDPLFIYAFDMGVKGAAVATVISQFLSSVFVLGFLFSKKASLRIEKKYMKPEAKILGRMFSLGVAPFIMASTESLIGFVFNSTLKIYGDVYVSALTVMQSAIQIVGVPLSGFSQGFVPIISYNYGTGNTKRIKECFKIAMTVMFTVNFVLLLLMAIFPEFTASMFTKDENLIRVVGEYMPVFVAGMTIFGLQRCCQNMFVALGQAKTSLFIALLRKVILLVPLVYVFSKFFGVTGVYAAESVADVLAATTCTVLFAIKFPKIMKEKQKI